MTQQEKDATLIDLIIIGAVVFSGFIVALALHVPAALALAPL